MKKIMEDYQKIKSNPRGRAFLFFGFYFVFFAVLLLCLKNPRNNNTISNSIEEELDNTPYSVESLMEDNYHYRYSITIDNVKYVFDGKKDGKIEQFSYSNKNYYYNGENCYVYDNTWLRSENPLLYKEFLDKSHIIDLIHNAYLESDTTYQSGKHTYHYLLDINVLFEAIFHEKTDYESDLDMMTVSMNENKEIDNVVFQLNHYCQFDALCQNTLRIELDYDQFGEIGDISVNMEG